MKKLKEFYGKNKKKCITAGVVVVAGIAYCVGADINIDTVVTAICNFVGCQ
ncbi:MAG: hypothetical protein J6T10_20160 [Methanobrevibacter sp.]|nr:hypothetical protein [Methanobrevibacter sp.]